MASYGESELTSTERGSDDRRCMAPRIKPQSAGFLAWETIFLPSFAAEMLNVTIDSFCCF